MKMKAYRFISLIVLLLSLIFTPLYATNTLLPNLKPQFFNSNGQILTGGYVAFYSPGTNNYKNVFGTYSSTTPIANPVALDSAGMASIWLNGFYDVAVYDGVNADPTIGDYGTLLYTVSSISSVSEIPSATLTLPYTDASEYVTLNATITALGTSNPAEVWVTDQQTLTGNLVIPANITVRVTRSGSIISNGYTITVNGPFEAPNQTVFLGFTSGRVLFGANSSKEVCPEWWGFAEAATGTINSLALNLAFATSYNVVLHGGVFDIASAVTWPTHYGWSLRGQKGSTILRATADINILTPPAADLGQYGTITGVGFKSSAGGTGTGIGRSGDNYIAHLRVEDCDFQSTLRYGINGIIIECDIFHNKFGFPASPAAVHFQAIRGIGSVIGRSTNANRIKYNEIVNCVGDYAVDIQGGYLLDFEGNTLEANATTSGVIHTDDMEVNLFKNNWFEQNGSAPTFVLDQGTVGSLVTVIDGGIINVISQGTTCIVDATDLTYKRLIMKNLVIAGQTHVVKNGSTYDDPADLSEWFNNFVTGATCPLNPTGSSTDFSFGGSGTIVNNLTVEGDLAVTGGFTASKFVSYSGDLVCLENTAGIAYTFPTNNVAPGVYLVSATPYTTSISNHAASAMVATWSSSGAFIWNSSGANTTLSLSGMNLKITQNDVGGGGLRYLVSITKVGG
jgi:hypothetical protein